MQHWFCWPKNWEESKTCRAFLLATKILQERCKDLENLTIGLGLGAQDFIETLLRDCSFLKLKSLDLKVAFALRSRIGSCTKLTQFLISRAPQLKTFYAHCPISLKENVLEGSSAVLVMGCPVQPFYDEISEGILSSLRLENVYLAVRNEDFSYERFDRNVKPLLKNSMSTLTSLTMDVMFTFLLISREFRLVNVKELKIYMDYRWLESRQPRLLSVFRGLDFNWIFPKVRKIKVDVNTEIGHIMLDRNRMNEPAWQGTLETPPPDRAVNVKELDVSASMENYDLPSIFRMFTRIEKLTIYRVNGDDIPYELIWEHYKYLKKLTVQQDSPDLHQLRPTNLDSVFCGIFPEEVAELRTKDEKFLKSVNIVPVMPSVTCLRGLRTFDLACRDADYQPRPPYYPYQGEVINFNSTFVFSKVTALLAFWRMPNLSIKLHTNFPDFEKALRHMRPYAYVYLEDQNGNPVISERNV